MKRGKGEVDLRDVQMQYGIKNTQNAYQQACKHWDNAATFLKELHNVEYQKVWHGTDALLL